MLSIDLSGKVPDKLESKEYVILAKNTTIRLGQQLVPYLNGKLWNSIYANIVNENFKVYSDVKYAEVYSKPYNFNKTHHSQATNNALEKTYKEKEATINQELDNLAKKRGYTQ